MLCEVAAGLNWRGRFLGRNTGSGDYGRATQDGHVPRVGDVQVNLFRVADPDGAVQSERGVDSRGRFHSPVGGKPESLTQTDPLGGRRVFRTSDRLIHHIALSAHAGSSSLIFTSIVSRATDSPCVAHGCLARRSTWPSYGQVFVATQTALPDGCPIIAEAPADQSPQVALHQPICPTADGRRPRSAGGSLNDASRRSRLRALSPWRLRGQCRRKSAASMS
jgi:hypothetical protein